MYGYIYLIINNVNDKTYIGKKKLYGIKEKWYNDTYMGSGKYIQNAEKKYGIENFSKFLLTYTDSEEDARKKMNKCYIGTHWFNNGLKNIRAKECPEGFVPGMLIKIE